VFGVVGIAGILLQPPFADPVVISPSVVPGMMAMSAVVLITIIFMRTRMRVSRVEGMVLILIGVARWVADIAFQGHL
jgi:Ca2+/Na+ antiporter